MPQTQQTFNFYPIEILVPDKINCHALTVNLPADANVASIDLVEENGKRKLRFWLIVDKGRKSTTCDFYLISKQKNTNCIKCPADKNIVSVLQFNHQDFILVSIIDNTFNVSLSLAHPGL
ncbi:MAG: hypothetical protein V1765_02650 [bacterium]